ncbi:MAG: molybdenum ABC transporter ATP-binding protein [Bacteroidia bacterium]|nr:MAG: molybdenum ABC transporter ATP-binding protein [Bacteroidia bacterium]
MIKLINIHIKAGSFRMDNISAEFEKEKFHVLLGPTGSGKTILLETIVGLIKPIGGDILINNIKSTSLPPEKRNIAYVPQNYSLFPHKNVYDNIAFGLKLKKNLTSDQINNQIKEISDVLNISHLLNRSTRHLSGGEQQRVALARSLVLNNLVLILDEPTSSLHETMQEDMALLLKDIQKKFKLTILMTTHHKDIAFMLADKLHFIDMGKLYISTDRNNINHIPLPLKIAELLGITNILTLKKVHGQENTYYSSELNTNFYFTNIRPNTDTFKLGIKPVDVRIVKEEEKHLNHLNTFCSLVDQIIYQESDAILITTHSSGLQLNIKLPTYTMKKMKIVTGNTIMCKIKEEHVRVVY